MDIGIDLGTTFSVIAVKGRVQLVDGYPEGLYLDECDVTIIPTPLGESTIPSVLWLSPEFCQAAAGMENPADLYHPEEPNVDEKVLVGTAAKQLAAEGERPVMFSKRSIGTNVPLKIHGLTLTAKQTAAFLLKYMKWCAERAVGQPLRRAVVTHPAYFERNQVDETRESAKAAGFDMSADEQMMMEPAAAALAYIHSDERDPLIVMTYDLGGGTFDVTVLERREGVIHMKTFDGDHLLGGYNFDRAIVQWMIDKLRASGRQIPHDENDPKHAARWARLLQIAEDIKLRLSDQRSPIMPLNVNVQDVLVDSEGVNVQFVDRLTRKQFSDLIKEHLDKTIECCNSALGKAGLTPEELDSVLLVGGSTYGRWIEERVQEAFAEQDVQVFNPDLCVASGAALMAADLPTLAESDGLTISMDVPRTSPLQTINVGGIVRCADGTGLDEQQRADLQVLLTTPDSGTMGPNQLNDNGQFLFTNVDLLEDEPTQLTVQIADRGGLDLLTQELTVEFKEESEMATDISSTLPKPLYLKTAGGMKLIAEEGEALPVKCEVTLIRLFGDDIVEIEVYQDDNEVGKVRVDNIPPAAGEGSHVIVTVEITPKNKMHGTAKVLLRAGGAVAAECPVAIRFPPLKVPDLQELRAQFDELESKREQEVALCDDPEQRLALGGQGAKISRKINKLFGELEPDRQEIHRATKDLDRLVNPPPDDMDPPRAQFRGLVENSRNMLSAAGTDPQLDPLRTALSQIERDGSDAFTTKNHRKWSTTNESLNKLHSRLTKVTSGGDEGGSGTQELPPTPILKDYFMQDVDSLRSSLTLKREEIERLPNYDTRLKPRCDEAARAIDQMEAAIDKVDDGLDPKRARGQLQIAVRAKQKLERQIAQIAVDVTL